MSKKSQAREAQNYRLEGPRCGNCYHFLSDSVPIKWMVESNDQHFNAGGRFPLYDLTTPANQKETNLRCQIGEFAVKKNACCDQWKDVNE